MPLSSTRHSLLHERLGILHVGAIALVVVGQVELTTDLGAFRMGSGEWMILGATLLWALEVVIAKRLLSTLSPLTVGTARLVIGCGVLLAWLAATGHLTQLVEATGEQWLWTTYTGVVLTAYVATWFAALARAQAVDVTAVLVLGAVVTALLGAVVEGNALRPHSTGLVLVFVGVVGVAIAALRARPAGELTPA
jgi:drug/metabolite transporter (DMT)-like permease